MKSSNQIIIIGAGLSGLCVAHKLRLQHQPFLLLEKGSSFGGVIESHRQDGYLLEKGPHGFLDNVQESQLILRETGLDKECVKASLKEFVRYVYLDGKLNLIPQSPKKIIMAPLISKRKKLRVLAELWKPVMEGEPTVAEWIEHRFGSALYPYVDAVFTGTYAGDFQQLSMDGVMPGLRKLEKEHGSVLRGAIKMMRQKQKNNKRAGKSFGMPAMTSFSGGMQRLVEKLAEPLHLGENLFYNKEVKEIRQVEDGWLVQCNGKQYLGKSVVLALPVNAALKLLARIDRNIPLTEMASTRIATIGFGFSDRTSIPKGFGFLSPEQEKRFTLGCLFSSNMFADRAPKGKIVIEALVGGRRHQERLELSDDELIQKAYTDLREILDLREEPCFSKVLWPTGGIPQLEGGYPGLLGWRDSFMENNPGIHICGFGWDGIGLNDMMKHASLIAEKLLSQAVPTGQSEVKGIYF